MSLPFTADVAIIGAGTAGLTAFSELRRLGLSAVLIDRGPLGTTCARVGCMPSKAVLHAGHQWTTLRALLKEQPSPSGTRTAQDLWMEARATRDFLANSTVEQTQEMAGKQLIMGEARFTGLDTLRVEGREIRARAFIVATGSSPVVPAALRSLGDRLLTTDSLFDLPRLPARVGILGLGAIGLEMGLALARLGVDVVAGDLKPLPAGISDPDIGARVTERMGREFTLWLGESMQAERVADHVRVRSGDADREVDYLLAALGRRPNVADLDLECAGVPMDEDGQPVLNERTLRAGESRVFLAGDVSALRPLMHEAVDEGRLAAQAAAQWLDGRVLSLQTRRTPVSIVFTDPDIASVGKSYADLDLAQTVIGTAEGTSNGRSRIMAATDNLVRLYADRATGKLVGASLMATRGEHLAHLLAWAIAREETAESLLELPFYHPSIEEMLQTALKVIARERAKS